MVARLVIAGTASNVGKTTVTVALARALRARGLRVAVFKCGPDYLDPTYHARAVEAPCHNLDGWMMGRDAVLSTFLRATQGADIALIEGVMGLYDGASPSGEEGSTAEVAKWLSAPVLLVCDASGMARSVAALARGFRDFDAGLHLGGLICNRVGSAGHLELLRKATGGQPRLFGGFPREDALGFPERHLGLRTADRSVLPDATLDAWGDRAREWLDLDGIVELASAAPALTGPSGKTERADAPLRCRIGVAFDEAFHFYYEDNLRRLESLGAELVRFTPLRDPHLPDVDGLYFGGGYPELHAAALSQNVSLLEDIRAFARAGKPVYGECGGLMYLCQAIRTQDGDRHGMAALLPGEAVVCERLQALGYVEVETQEASLLGPAGVRFRGHQFRYSELRGVPEDFRGIYTVRRRRGDQVLREGYRAGSVVGSYVHAHWASNPGVARYFVEACAAAPSQHRNDA
jgi:cobyrinic acid a,c-diamide synthase